MRREPASGVIACQASTAGQRVRQPFRADRISYTGRSTLCPHRGAEQSTNDTMRCYREDFRSPSGLCASPPPARAMAVPSESREPMERGRRLAGSGTIAHRA